MISHVVNRIFLNFFLNPEYSKQCIYFPSKLFFKIYENNTFSVEIAEVLMVYFIGPSREQCMLCIFTSPNSISHDLKLELHPNYFICLSTIILL